MDDLSLRQELEQLHRESYAWALRCCFQDGVSAEETLQTVYLKILEGKARFNGRSSFKTWIFSVIRNTAVSEQRRNFLRKLLLMKYDESHEHDINEEYDNALDRPRIQLLFRRALAALPRRQQEVLHLVFYHDLSVSDAAEVMGISIGSARTHYERAKQRLRQQSEMFHELR